MRALRGAQLLTGFADGYIVSLTAATGEVQWARAIGWQVAMPSNAADAASGVYSVAANVKNVTSGQTALALPTCVSGCTVGGVAPPGFRHPGQSLQTDVEVWAPSGWSANPFRLPIPRGAYIFRGALAAGAGYAAM